MSTKLTNLTAADGIDGTESLYVVKSGNSRKTTTSVLLDQDNMTDGTTNKNYTAAEQTKLAGIETGADVTDATNVNAAGAVMNTDTATTDMQFVGTGSDLSIDPAKLLKRGDAADAIDAAVTPVVATRTALAAVATAEHTAAYLTEAGRGGQFVQVDYADWSTQVDADTLQGVFVRSTDDTTKAWMRSFIGSPNAAWWGLVDGNTGDNSGAIQAALDFLAGSTFTYGAVYIPRGKYRTTSTIDVPKLVSVFGDPGYGTQIYPDGCDGFRFDFTNGYGNTVIRDIGIYGTNCTTKTALVQPGSLDDAYQMYGLTLDSVLIRDFNLAVSLRSIQFARIVNCWFENIGAGVSAKGKVYGLQLHQTKIIMAAGCGTSAGYGVLADEFNFTDGLGPLSPESLHVIDCQVHGFTHSVQLEKVLDVTIRNPDFSGLNEVIRVNVARSNVTIRDGYIQLLGASGSSVIRFIQQTTALDTKIVIEGATIMTSGGAAGTVSGILLATAGTGNAGSVSIRDNDFYGNTLYDISAYGSGNIIIEGNRCQSSVATSIALDSVPANRPVYVRHNQCAGVIAKVAADVSANKVIIGPNVISGVTDMGREGHDTYAGSPNTHLTAGYIGRECFDSTNGKWYKANAADNASWVALN